MSDRTMKEKENYNNCFIVNKPKDNLSKIS